MDKKKKKQGADFYELLELSPEASQEQVKSQYRKLALKWHPDKNGNSPESTERFKLISEAYSVLSNPDRRRHYDKYGTVADDEESEAAFFEEFEQMFFGGAGMFGGSDFDEMMDFLEKDTKHMRKMFRDLGKGARVPGSRKGRKKQAADLDDMLSFFMMPNLKVPKKKAKKKAKEEEGWETEEEELDAEDGKVKAKKDDDGWETLSD